MGSKINAIFQDKQNNYWFASNGEGVYRYDGKTLVRFTEKNGLCNDYVQTIQEDASGNTWFGTIGGISKFDGNAFSTFTPKDSLQIKKEGAAMWENQPGDLWFEAGAGAYRYSEKSFTYLKLPRSESDKKMPYPAEVKNPYTDPLSPYYVYCSMKDRNGNLWFGTQSMGVCRYSPAEDRTGSNAFTWLTEKGLAGPAVRGLFEDSNGNMWFGNNGGGLFKYDGKTLTNFTEENGLGNPDFIGNGKLSGQPRPGTLARVWAINEDGEGNIWIGTVDSGVWKYDHKNLINYTMKDDLSSNAINIIYKDKNGELWFGTDGGGVCRFNGMKFSSWY